MVVIAGGHGKIALRLTRILSARGEDVVGLIRNPDHADDLRADGGRPVVCDLEQANVPQIAAAITGASAVVFGAGAGPGSGAQRKLTIDRDGAIKLLEAVVEVGVPRYLMISSVGAENPPDGDDVFSVYLRAKAEADQAVQASDRGWTIIRPGRLTDEPAAAGFGSTSSRSAARSLVTTSRPCWTRCCESRVRHTALSTSTPGRPPSSRRSQRFSDRQSRSR